MMEGNDLNGSMNDTAESIGGNDVNFEDEPEYEEITEIFSNFFRENVHNSAVHANLRDRNIRIREFAKNKSIFPEVELKDHKIRAFDPEPNLYFLPVTIIVPHHTDMIQLRDRIIK